jgi:hypothetical protein
MEENLVTTILILLVATVMIVVGLVKSIRHHDVSFAVALWALAVLLLVNKFIGPLSWES